MTPQEDINTQKANREELEVQKLASEVSKVSAEAEKLKQETLNLNSSRSRLGSAAAVARDLSITIGLLTSISPVINTIKSLDLARAAETRLQLSAESEIQARAENARNTANAEIRLRETTARELEVRALATFLTDILPRVSGSSSPHLISECIAARSLNTRIDSVSAHNIVTGCVGFIPFPRAVQLGAYEAAVDLAIRFPFVCRATRAAIEANVMMARSHNSSDENAVRALNRLPHCPQLTTGTSR
jgi:hypothetical protein